MSFYTQFHRVWLMAAVISMNLCRAVTGQEVPGFGPTKGKPPLPGFHRPEYDKPYAELALLVNDVDRRNAYRDVKRADKNGDWVLDAEEMKAVGFDVEVNDLNKDDRVPLWEMTLRWAQYRTRNQRARKNSSANTKARSQSSNTTGLDNSQQRNLAIEPDVRAREQLTGNVARQIVASFDRNRNNILEPKEWQSADTTFGNVTAADVDRNGQIDVSELSHWFSQRLPSLASSRLAPELRVLDANRDGQVSLAEYAMELTEETLAEFHKYDRNADGLITPDESRLVSRSTEARYRNNQPRVLQPQVVVTSEIWIDEDFVIDDIDVQVLITKRSDDYLHLSLEGPEGQSVVLFRGRWQPWRGAPLFDNTVLDDEAEPINNAPRPPVGLKTFPPEGVGTQDAASLSYFYGKRSRGTWRLVVRNLDGFGLAGWMREWSLLIKHRGNE